MPNCAEAGVIGALPGLVGSIQAIETIKIVMGIGETLTSRLLLIDALTMEFREVKVRRRPGCKLCGLDPGLRTHRLRNILWSGASHGRIGDGRSSGALSGTAEADRDPASHKARGLFMPPNSTGPGPRPA